MDIIAFEATSKKAIKDLTDLWDEYDVKSSLGPVLDHIGREHIDEDAEIRHWIRDDRLLLLDGSKTIYAEARMKELGFRHGRGGDYKGWYASPVGEKGRALHAKIQELCPWHPFPRGTFGHLLSQALIDASDGALERFTYVTAVGHCAFSAGALPPTDHDGRCVVCFKKHFAKEGTLKLKGFKQIPYSEYVAMQEAVAA